MLQLDGYKDLELIGDGPRATLYKGTHVDSGNLVVLKELRVPTGVTTEERRRILDRYIEVCNWQKDINHPNLVNVLEVALPIGERDNPILVMEQLETSLEDVLREQKSTDAFKILGWLVQIQLGLKALHKHQIIHRDLKPDNIMFDGQGRIKLIDVCSAVRTGQKVTLQQKDISTQYSAPELYLAGVGASFSSDIYSAGFIAYEMLLGRPKFKEVFDGILGGDSDKEDVLRWMNWHTRSTAPAPPLHELLVDFAPFISSVIGKMMDKSVSERYQTAVEPLEELLLGARAERENSLLFEISPYIYADFFEDPSDYPMLAPEHFVPCADRKGARPTTPGIGSESTSERLPVPRNRPRFSKSVLIAVSVVSSLLLLTLGGYLWIRDLQTQRSIEAILERYGAALAKYEASEYKPAASLIEEGMSYIESLEQPNTYEGYVQGFTIAGEDVAWVGRSVELLQETSARLDSSRAIQGEALPAISEELRSLAETVYVQGERGERLHKVSENKYADVKSKAASLIAELEAAALAQEEQKRQEELLISTTEEALSEGKYRLAYYLLVNSTVVDENLMQRKEELAAIIALLDQGRQSYEQKHYSEAQVRFQEAWDMSGQQLLEAGYYLQLINLWAIGSLSPRLSNSWSNFDAQGNSLESELLELFVQMTELYIRKYDLKQDVEAQIQSLSPRLQAMEQRLKEQISRQLQENTYFDVVPAGEMAYPLEDSRKYYELLLGDLLVLKFRVALEAQNLDEATSILKTVTPLLPVSDAAFYNARLQEKIAFLTSPDGSSADSIMQLYDSILEQFPHWAEAMFRKGVVAAYIKKDYREAIKYFVEAAKALPGNERYRWQAARIAEEAGYEGWAQKNEKIMREYFNACLQLRPSYPNALFGLALTEAYFGKDPIKSEQYLKEFEAAFAARNYIYTDEDVIAKEKVPELRKYIAQL